MKALVKVTLGTIPENALGYWIKWKMIIAPKEIRGLKFGDIEGFNKASNGKLLWKKMTKSHLLASNQTSSAEIRK